MSISPMLLGLPQLPQDMNDLIESVERAVKHIAAHPDKAIALIGLGKVAILVTAQAVNPEIQMGCQSLRERGLFKTETPEAKH